MKYWTTRLGSEFSIDIYLDTNILEYLVNNQYPSLTKLLDELALYPDFVTLKTTKYVIFEFCEIRKRYYFRNLALSKGEDLNDKKVREFDSGSLNFEEECVPIFLEEIKRDRDKIIYDYNLEISKEFHSKLWKHTLEVSLRTRLSREDCFVIASSLMPDESSIPQLISLITNDKHLSDSIYDSNLLSVYLNDNNLVHPIVWHIGCNDNTVKCFGERNLTENYDDDFISSYCKEIILKFLMNKQKDNFIGKTFTVAPQLNDVIGVKVDENSVINISNENRIVIVSKDLDFIILSPKPIENFRYRNRNQIALPFSVNEIDAFTFQFPSFDKDTIQGKCQIEIFSRLKERNHFVFLLPT